MRALPEWGGRPAGVACLLLADALVLESRDDREELHLDRRGKVELGEDTVRIRHEDLQFGAGGIAGRKDQESLFEYRT